MKDEKETLRKTADSIHVMEKFDPAILADVTAPVVSLYIPVHHTEREERRDIWDRDMFKDLMKDAERTLAETYDKDAYKGIVEKADYLLEHPDMPLWLHAGEGLGFLMNNDDIYVYNLFFAPEPMVPPATPTSSSPCCATPVRHRYYVLELGNDRFSWVKATAPTWSASSCRRKCTTSSASCSPTVTTPPPTPQGREGRAGLHLAGGPHGPVPRPSVPQ